MNAVRFLLKGIYRKTSVGSQAQLVAQIRNLPLHQGDGGLAELENYRIDTTSCPDCGTFTGLPLSNCVLGRCRIETRDRRTMRLGISGAEERGPNS
ncbi:MAG TPA: hypothetical protein VII56_23090 [Rhizomicrobium sp.]